MGTFDGNNLPVFQTSASKTAQNQKFSLGENVELQYHSTKIFDHNIEVDGVKLSELKEVTEITVLDTDHEKLLGTIMLHSRTIGNRKLEIITENSDSNEIIDHKIRTFVTIIADSTCITRAMSTPELRKFKIDWNKLWKPKFTDIQLQEYVNQCAHLSSNIQKDTELLSESIHKPKISYEDNPDKVHYSTHANDSKKIHKETDLVTPKPKAENISGEVKKNLK